MYNVTKDAAFIYFSQRKRFIYLCKFSTRLKLLKTSLRKGSNWIYFICHVFGQKSRNTHLAKVDASFAKFTFTFCWRISNFILGLLQTLQYWWNVMWIISFCSKGAAGFPFWKVSKYNIDNFVFSWECMNLWCQNNAENNLDDLKKQT